MNRNMYRLELEDNHIEQTLSPAMLCKALYTIYVSTELTNPPESA